ncbi:hypothetical protein AB0L35_38445 [Streptomyces sp. NPDC052309]|uniref:hypothetical protein n=1 Tax=Streptomyces sp. NPDC052309 TaxID=3155421 RepID=UPI00341224A3
MALLRDAESVGLRVSLVNIMTMDYGSEVDDMGDERHVRPLLPAGGAYLSTSGAVDGA